MNVERFNLRQVIELEVRKKYQIKISNRFAGWDILFYSEENNRLRRTENNKI